MDITYTKLISGDKDNTSQIALYTSDPDIAEMALNKMLKCGDYITQLTTAIFRQPIDEKNLTQIVARLTLFDAYKANGGDCALAGITANDLFFATWVNYLASTQPAKNVNRIVSEQSLRDARNLTDNLSGNNPLDYRDYLVKQDALEKKYIEFTAHNKDYSVAFIIMLPIIEMGSTYRLGVDHMAGLFYPTPVDSNSKDKDIEGIIPADILLNMVKEEMHKRGGTRFNNKVAKNMTSNNLGDEASKTLAECCDTGDLFIDEILGINSYKTVYDFNAEGSVDVDGTTAELVADRVPEADDEDDVSNLEWVQKTGSKYVLEHKVKKLYVAKLGETIQVKQIL